MTTLVRMKRTVVLLVFKVLHKMNALGVFGEVAAEYTLGLDICTHNRLGENVLIKLHRRVIVFLHSWNPVDNTTQGYKKLCGERTQHKVISFTVLFRYFRYYAILKAT